MMLSWIDLANFAFPVIGLTVVVLGLLLNFTASYMPRENRRFFRTFLARRAGLRRIRSLCSAAVKIWISIARHLRSWDVEYPCAMMESVY